MEMLDTHVHEATSDDVQRLRELIEAHIKESGLDMTLDELFFSVNLFLPIKNEQDIMVGFIAYDSVETVNYGKIAVWKILYTDPKYRKKFSSTLTMVLNFFKARGYTHVETQCNDKVDNFYRRRLKSVPKQYVHFGKIESYLRRLNK